jgi:hypothetical protein
MRASEVITAAFSLDESSCQKLCASLYYILRSMYFVDLSCEDAIPYSQRARSF